MSAPEPLQNTFRFSNSLKSVAKVITGNIVTSLIAMVTSILVARWTLPHDMGIWNAALLASVYSPTLQAGVFNGLNRELPYLIGTGNKSRALRMASAAYAWSWLLVGLSVVAGLGVTLWLWATGATVTVSVTLAVAVTVACSWHTLYLTTTYRTNDDFGRLATNTVVVAIFGTVLVVLVWRYHFTGLLLRASLLAVLGVLALYYRRPMPVRPRWGTKELFELARVGVPIWLVGQLGAFFMSLDRLMLVRSTEVLGYFTIAIQVATFARMTPTAFSHVLYPQMAHRYGETHSAMEMWRISARGAVTASCIGLATGIGGWFFLPIFVRTVLPRYTPGIRAAQWSSFIGLAMGLYVFDNVYNVIKKQHLYLISFAVGVVSFGSAWYLLVYIFHVSLAVASAQAMLFATFVMAITSAIVSRKACLVHDREKRSNASPKDATDTAINYADR